MEFLRPTYSFLYYTQTVSHANWIHFLFGIDIKTVAPGSFRTGFHDSINFTEDEKKVFSIKYNYPIKDNHFYVTAQDTIENTTSIIFHVFDNVKILEPNELKKEVNNKIQQYMKKNPW